MSERGTLTLKKPLPKKTVRKLEKAARAPKTKAEIREEQRQVRSRRMEKILETRAILATRFPAAFMAKGKPKLPLKIGIDKDVMAHVNDLSRSAIRKAIADYARGATYLRALAKGGARVGIDGAPAGEVLAEHSEHAKEALAKLKARKFRRHQ